MKIAILILVHKNENQVDRLLQHLSRDFAVYVHVDKRVNKRLFQFNYQNVFIYRKYKTYWGSFNIVKAILLLMREASNKNYDRYILISGQDLPLKTNLEISSFYINNKNEYIDINTLPATWNGYNVLDRVTKYHPAKIYKTKKDIGNVIIYCINRVFLTLISKLIPRPVDYAFCAGSNWFALTDICIKKILSFLDNDCDGSKYIKRFHFTLISDEVFFQTLISLLNISNIDHDNMRYIDWKSGPEHPRILRIDDYEKMINTNNLFARKFDDAIDNEIIDIIYKKIKSC